MIDDRESFIVAMKEMGITCGIHYRAAHLNPVYSLGLNENLPLSIECDKKTVSIPYHENLDKHDIKIVIESIRDYLGSK